MGIDWCVFSIFCYVQLLQRTCNNITKHVQSSHHFACSVMFAADPGTTAESGSNRG